MTSSKKLMRNYDVFGSIDVHLSDDDIFQAIASGDIVMSMKTLQGVKKGVLTNVWQIPKISRTLFFVGCFTKDVGPVVFDKEGCFAETKGAKLKIGVREGKEFFKLHMTPVFQDEANVVKPLAHNEDIISYLWHLRLGHIDHDGLSAIVKKNLTIGIDIASLNKCGFVIAVRLESKPAYVSN